MSMVVQMLGRIVNVNVYGVAESLNPRNSIRIAALKHVPDITMSIDWP